ncbi:MAG: hypothetical protein MH321_10820 [Leptospiraceae bacterium]|nr:hypothetical protein [Leptospiraceae bacterium]
MIAKLPESKYIYEIHNKLSYYKKSKPSLLIRGRFGSRIDEIIQQFLETENLEFNEIDFRLVANTTIFKDEWETLRNSTKIILFKGIDSLSKELQSLLYKELLNLRNQEYKPWIISTASYRINDLMEKKSFLFEMYQILATSNIDLIPISENKKEMPILAKYFLDCYAKFYKKRLKYIDESYLNFIIKYDFPGDLEELENLLHQSVIAGKGRTLILNDIPKNFYENSKSKYERNLKIIPGVSLKEYEKQILKENLAINKGNREITAKILKIPIRSFYRKLDEHNLKDSNLQ